MVAKVLPRLALAPLIALALVACSANTGSSTSGTSPAIVSSPAGTTPADTSTPAGTATAANDTVCTALADVKSSASTLRSDLEARNLTAVRSDISTLETAFKSLLDGMSSGAQKGAEQLRSAWDNVKTTFEGLSKSDIGQIRSTMQGPVDQLKTTLESVTNGLSCS